MRQTIQFIQQKPFLQINREKTFLFLKKQDTENLTKKTVIVFHQIIEKKSSNELKNNLKSDKTLHNLPAHKNRSNHVQEKIESTTKQSHKRTHQKQFSSIKQNFF